ncbi:unnamed protein product [Acanthocheilonema viteae]|uniref:Uncharacterized protein n=1 Tax=Acanthocheilonema viteae TaxID=6277 RepID=A0A498SU08_ACAVI|nr:unnamed protein product [Acanthocheilonema viteae]
MCATRCDASCITGGGGEVERVEGRNAGDEMDEEPVSQEPQFNEEEVSRPENNDEAEDWSTEAEWALLPQDAENGFEIPMISMETSCSEEPEESVRELLLIPRTMTIAVLAAQKTLITAISRKFHPADFRDPAGNSGRSCKCRGQSHTRVWHMQRAVRNTKRVAHSRLENARAGWHDLVLPPQYTAVQEITALELHNLDWCPRKK